MKTKFFILMLVFTSIAFSASAQVKVYSGNDVCIGSTTVTPIANLDVVGYMHVYGNTNPTVTTQGGYLNWNALTGGSGSTSLFGSPLVNESWVAKVDYSLIGFSNDYSLTRTPVTLTVNLPSTGDTTAIVCTSFKWNDSTYTSTPSVAPTKILTNHVGCDSTVTLNLTITTCTGIPEINSDSHLLIYPNPSASNITIECPQQGIIEMYNMEGQLVNNITTTGNKTNIDVSALPIGMYVITVKTENGISRQKFIKE